MAARVTLRVGNYLNLEHRLFFSTAFISQLPLFFYFTFIVLAALVCGNDYTDSKRLPLGHIVGDVVSSDYSRSLVQLFRPINGDNYLFMCLEWY